MNYSLKIKKIKIIVSLSSRALFQSFNIMSRRVIVKFTFFFCTLVKEGYDLKVFCSIFQHVTVVVRTFLQSKVVADEKFDKRSSITSLAEVSGRLKEKKTSRNLYDKVLRVILQFQSDSNEFTGRATYVLFLNLNYTFTILRPKRHSTIIRNTIRIYCLN